MNAGLGCVLTRWPYFSRKASRLTANLLEVRGVHRLLWWLPTAAWVEPLPIPIPINCLALVNTAGLWVWSAISSLALGYEVAPRCVPCCQPSYLCSRDGPLMSLWVTMAEPWGLFLSACVSVLWGRQLKSALGLWAGCPYVFIWEQVKGAILKCLIIA